MGYTSLRAAVQDLERTKQLIRIETEIDADLEAAEIQRRVYLAQGPALFFTRVKGCPFPMVSNLYGTMERTRFLFRDTLKAVRHLVELKVDPNEFWQQPWRYWDVPAAALHMLPQYVNRGPILSHETRISQLPQLRSWPKDGGGFVTLPQVYSEDADKPGWRFSNLGMYRVQLTGNRYQPDREIGLHYQIHRGIGVHHAKAIRKGLPFKVSIFVGGPPAMALAAVMPLPEGLPELAFAGALGGRRVRLVRQGPEALPLFADADFAIVGTVDPERQLPEGPFGDHLGYYAQIHDFPVLQVEKVYHRPNAIWPFTVVGRPPQEDTTFGEIIHEITGPIIPTVLPGVKSVHAVDATGVHPLLLALGSERYVPYAKERLPQELLTQACAILGQGQLSLAKFLLIVAHEDNPELDIHDIPAVFKHYLERVDWTRDCHFLTKTTIDTLDYSGEGLNQGSKLILAAAGAPRRKLPLTLYDRPRLPREFGAARLCLPGVAAISGPSYKTHRDAVEKLVLAGGQDPLLMQFPLWVLVDDAEFVAQHLNNFLWVTFTRANPSHDVHGVGASIANKHWGCTGPLVIDARIKPHHSWPLEEDPAITKRVNALAAPGGPLHKII